MGEGLAPSMQHRKESDIGAQPFGIGGNRLERFCRGPKQDAVQETLVLQGQSSQLIRKRKHDMEVLDREKLTAPLVQPPGARQGPALGAVPVAAGIISDALMAASIALFEMAAQCFGAASLQGV